jgi:CheY-like chemotaxis protein
MLQGGLVDQAKAKKAFDVIVRNALAQSQIIDDLLDVSRIIAGQLRLDLDFLDIRQVIEAAVDAVRSLAESKGVVLETALDPDSGIVRGDSGRLQQVVWNLLTNAVKFTPREGRVSLTTRRAESALEIVVADNGRGITPNFLPLVFGRFAQQEGSHARKAGGLGLGLAIVKHLVELHGGTVEARSEGDGLGATFIVRLPLAPIRGGVASGGDEEHLPATEISFPPGLVGLRVLVVDDEPDARYLLQTVLERGGAKVKVATSAAAAFESIRLDLPDVIVSDIGMPEVDGYDFIRRLRQLPGAEGGRIPAVALTAFARTEDRRKALQAGFQDHASKPMDPQELVTVVARLVGRSG